MNMEGTGSPAGQTQQPDDQLMVPAKMVGGLNVKSTGMLKNWKQRWYELRGRHLYCFKGSETEKPSSMINLQHSMLVVEPPPNQKLKFNIKQVKESKVYEFQALNSEDLTKWVEQLRSACGAGYNAGGGGGGGGTVTQGQTTQSPSRLHLSLQHLKLFDAQDERKPVTIKDFELVSELGKGSYGRVLKVQKRDAPGVFYALKVMKKEAITKPREVMSERAVLQNIDHPFIVKLINAFQSPSKLFLVLTHLPGGDLKHHLKEGTLFAEEKARFYAAGILLALEHLHTRSIIYRDLKPENLVLDEVGYPVLTDMGLARELLFDPVAYTFCGTPLYVAPEVLRNKGYTKAVDWWSYGVILYEMFLGITPFAAKTAQAVFQLIISKSPQVPRDLLTPATSNLLERLLIKDPVQRLSEPEEIRSHKFFAGIDWSKYARRQYIAPGKGQTRSASVKLTEQQIRELLADFKEDAASTRHKPETFQGFTFFGDGKDQAPQSPVLHRSSGGYQGQSKAGSPHQQHRGMDSRGRPHHGS
eukprot:TRINITY_DN4467_c0_g2_i2.p1 TRINITY_DN4467_c0_g2~~TRINITY_DN4467_c0_g2_i2.p1  ORF type:complete len:529 (+),score=122.02 TRINITY_DN4467_c0_g2_i2:46-1632(+)